MTALQGITADQTVRACSICARSYTFEEFLGFEPPAGRRGAAHDFLWRQCGTLGCGNTLSIPDPSEPRRPGRAARPVIRSIIGRHGAIAHWINEGLYQTHHDGRLIEIRRTPSCWRIEGRQYERFVSAQSAVDAIGAP